MPRSARHKESCARRCRHQVTRGGSPRPTADRPTRPGRVARGAEPHPRAGPGAGAPRAHARLAVHVLPRCGQDHGRRPQGHAEGRPERHSSAAMPTCRTSACSHRRSEPSLFDLNDFDETLPGPFEYDVKRMAASFTIAARNNGFTKADTRDATLASVRAYREAMAEFAPDAAPWTSGMPICPRNS